MPSITSKIPYWEPFKHPAPYRGNKWAVKTPRGVFGFKTKKMTKLFIATAGPYDLRGMAK